MLPLREMDLRVFQATEKEVNEPCGVRSDAVTTGQWVVTCPRCLTLSHVNCWNVEARCPSAGCPTQGRALAQRTVLTSKGCPYCAEPLPGPNVEQCPHCKEYLNQILLRESLELERYKRCPRGLKGLSLWYKFNSLIFWAIAFAALGSPPVPSLIIAGIFGGIGAGLWKLGNGVREGRPWARTMGYALSVLYIISLNGLLIGLICMSTLASRESQIYFEPQRGDAT